MLRAHKSYRVTCRRGAIAVMAAIALIAMVVLMAMTLDIGYMLTVRTDMQAAADAGALAAVGELPNGRQAARVAAKDYVERNAIVNSTVNQNDVATTVEFGHWTAATRLFAKNQQPLNAAKVVADRSNAPHFFANALKNKSFGMSASAIATYQPRDIMLVLDYSGSMNTSNKIGALKDSVAVFISVLQQSRANDRVGFSVYSTTGSLAQSLTLNLPSVLQDVRSRSANGWTNMGEGMEKGRIELTNNARRGTKKLMVVMTDGMANRPQNPTVAIQYVRDEASACATAGIPIVAISFSSASHRQIMAEIANTTQGVHYHIAGSVRQQERELKRVFREIAAKRPLLLVD